MDRSESTALKTSGLASAWEGLALALSQEERGLEPRLPQCRRKGQRLDPSWASGKRLGSVSVWRAVSSSAFLHLWWL